MLKKFIGASILALFLSFQVNSYANPDRSKMPSWLVGTWFAVNLGYVNLPYTNNDLESGLTAHHIETPEIAIQGEIGHYFNPYIAAEFSLLRTLGDPKYIGIAEPADYHNVMASFFSLALRPTLPLSRKFWLYGETGVGYVSRKGFKVNNIVGIKSNGVYSPMIGGGLSYRVNDGIFLNVKLRYMFANNGMKQPSLFFAGIGFYYLLTEKKRAASNNASNYVFPLNTIELSYYDHYLFEVDASKAFSPPYIPIFFQGAVDVTNGGILMYLRNFFHTKKNFSLEWGLSVGTYASRELRQQFVTVSIFPEIRIWMVRCPRFDLYFTYSIAGPSYISRYVIDGRDSGGNFTFQDFLGLGAILGSGKHVSVALKIVHYSSGNLYSHNPGIKVPVMFALAYTW